MKKNKIQEAKFVVGDPNAAVTLASTNKLQKTDTVVVDKNAAAKASLSLEEEDNVLEPEAVIAPQDDATIKYLSNVKDSKTGKVSQPFTIGAQKYQMVRGMTADKQIVMAVYCHDEKDEMGNNVIHAVDHFEQNIALPMLEREKSMMSEVSEKKEDETYEGCKHFLVDTKTNKVRKFKTVEDLLSANKTENEVYMGAAKFKKHTTERLFGKRKKMNEMGVEPVGSEEDMSNKANKLMDIIDDNTSVQNAIKTIKTPDAKKEVIAAFAELIGVPRSGLSNLVSQMKTISKQPVTQPTTETKVMTKNQLLESIKPKTVIKTIKVKDIK